MSGEPALQVQFMRSHFVVEYDPTIEGKKKKDILLHILRTTYFIALSNKY